MTSLRSDNRRLGWQLALAALAMGGIAYLLVPLYQGFCQLTGLNGTTSHIDYSAALSHQPNTERWVTVEFVTDTAGNLPWEFRPIVGSLRVHPGELVTTRFRARNLGNVAMLGQAVPSVTPSKAAAYFYSVDGLCDSGQALAPGESKDLALQFVVDRELPPGIATLTLSVAFFEALSSPLDGADAPRPTRRRT